MLCIRCKEQFGDKPYCQECGVHKHRVVKRFRRSRPIGGKRGSNSGHTSNAKGGGSRGTQKKKSKPQKKKER